MATRHTFKQTFLGSLLAGGIALVANNLWHLVHGATAGFTLPNVIHPGSVSLSSTLPLIVAGIGYFIAQRWVPKGRLVYTIGTVLLALLSCMGNFGATLPDGTPAPAGFAIHTVPMHLIAGACALLIPRLASRVNA